jgi:RNA polymerase sigma-70 factor, ECF subfamily
MDFYPFDDDYVRRLREGDRVIEDHYSGYFKPLLTAALHRRGMSFVDIEDVIQDTHLRVLNQLRNGRGIRDSHAFGGLVYTTCIHVAQEFERKRRKTTELDENRPSPDPDALRGLLRKEVETRVRRALQELARENPRDARILHDLYFRERTKDQICENHGVDRDYLRVLLHRALKKFREEYDDPDDS